MIEKFRFLIENFSEFWILCISVEIGIFERINKGSGHIDDMIKETKWNKDVVEALYNCLVAYKYLEKKDETYYLTETSKKYLLKGSPEYMGYFAESARAFNVLSMFTNYIISGEKISISGEDWEVITKISALIGEDVPDFLFEKIKLLKNDSCSILDIGCGRMRESIKMAEANPKLKVIGIESNKKIVAEVVDELRQKDLSERVKILEGDAGNFNINFKPDVVLLNHIIHCLPHETNVKMLKNIRRLQANHGYIVVFEDLLNDDRISPKESVKKNLLVKILESKIYSVLELKELLQNTGFKEVEHKHNKRRIIVVGKINNDSGD